MKLYTEEQVRLLLNEILILSSSVDDAIDSLTPIELPSDEDVESKSELLFPYAKYNPDSIPSYSIKAFQKGAHWMKEQILNQNK